MKFVRYLAWVCIVVADAFFDMPTGSDLSGMPNRPAWVPDPNQIKGGRFLVLIEQIVPICIFVGLLLAVFASLVQLFFE